MLLPAAADVRRWEDMIEASNEEGTVRIDFLGGASSVDGRELSGFTRRPRQFLAFLVHNQARQCSSREVHEAVWNMKGPVGRRDESKISTHATALRGALGNPKWINGQGGYQWR